MTTAARARRLNLVAVPILGVIGFFWVYPFLWTIAGAFKTQLGIFTGGASLIPRPPEWGNFQRAWEQAGFNAYFLNTVIYSVSSTVIELAKSVLCGYVLARARFRGRDLLYKVIVFSLFIPIASIIIPQFVLVHKIGLLNTRAGVILAMSGGTGALYVLLFTAFFRSLPGELFDAARMDGATFPHTFQLMLPLARPVVAVVLIFQFLHSWNEFNIPLVFTLGQPRLQNLAVGMLSFQGEHSMDWTGFAAGMTISVIPALLVFLLFQGYFVRGLSGAVKE